MELLGLGGYPQGRLARHGRLPFFNALAFAPGRSSPGGLPAAAAAQLCLSPFFFVVALPDYRLIGGVRFGVASGRVFFCVFFSFFLAWFVFFSYFCAFKSISYARRLVFFFRLRPRRRRGASGSSLFVRRLCGRHPLWSRVVAFVPRCGGVSRLRWRLGRSRSLRVVGRVVGGLCGRVVVGCVRWVGWRSCWRSPVVFVFLIFFNACFVLAARMPPVLTGKKKRFLKKKSCWKCCAY